MKCPFKFRLQGFEGGEECDRECAWLIIDRRTLCTACAVSALASKGDFFVINYNEHQEEKPVGALGRYSEKEDA